MPYQPLDRFVDAYNNFYDKILNSQLVGAE
jgi:hypothetical protein